jgi:hypothetical protein
VGRRRPTAAESIAHLLHSKVALQHFLRSRIIECPLEALHGMELDVVWQLASVRR